MIKIYPVQTQGFSLIELMIVVTIISILAAIALPSYKNYTLRARFAEVISTTEVYKLAVSLALQQGAEPGELTNGKYGIPPKPKPTKNLASLVVENGIIMAIGTDIVRGATYILTPDEEGNRWTVSGTCIKTGFCHV